MPSPVNALGEVHSPCCCHVTNNGQKALPGQPALRLTRNANPLRRDPTRTSTIRKRFIAEVKARFRQLQNHVRQFLVEDDALGLSTTRPKPVTLARASRRQYAFLTSPQKLEAFNNWLAGQIDEDLLAVVGNERWQAPLNSIASGPWTGKYIESAYKRGVVNAFLQARKEQLSQEPGFGEMSQEQFLRESFSAPETVAKVQLLGTRAFEGMKGLTAQMKSELNRVLAQGIADGRGAEDIADQIAERVGVSEERALRIARTEVIHAHAEGQLDSFQELGVEELGIMAEWSTAGDDRVCPRCQKFEGKLFTIQKARGLIPLHPNCRCSWIPAEAPKKKKKKRA